MPAASAARHSAANNRVRRFSAAVSGPAAGSGQTDEKEVPSLCGDGTSRSFCVGCADTRPPGRHRECSYFLFLSYKRAARKRKSARHALIFAAGGSGQNMFDKPLTAGITKENKIRFAASSFPPSLTRRGAAMKVGYFRLIPPSLPVDVMRWLRQGTERR